MNNMKNFLDWLKINEATLKGSEGIPSDDYLKGIERKGLGLGTENQVRIPQAFGELMALVNTNDKICRGKEKELVALAKKLIQSQYGSIIDGVCELNIDLVKKGEIDMGESKLQEKEKEKQEEEEEKPKEKKKKISFKNLFKEEAPKEMPKEEVNKKLLKSETDKRKLANNIIQGEAKNTKYIIYSDDCKKGLESILGKKNGEELHKNLVRLTRIMDALDWLIPEEEQKRMWDQDATGFAGKVKVDWKKKPDSKPEEDQEEEEEEEENCSINKDGDIDKENAKENIEGGQAVINAYGTDFIMLIHEAVKGIYELIASSGQASDIEVAKAVALDADDLFNELEDLRYGPFIAADLRDFLNKNKDIEKHPNLREHFFGAMMLLDSEEFLDLMKGILMKTGEARKQVDSMIADIIKKLDEWELGQHIDLSKEEEEEEPDGEYADDVLNKLTKKEEKGDEGIDYSKLSKRELQEEIDAALDEEDYKKVDMLVKFLKESVKFRK